MPDPAHSSPSTQRRVSMPPYVDYTKASGHAHRSAFPFEGATNGTVPGNRQAQDGNRSFLHDEWTARPVDRAGTCDDTRWGTSFRQPQHIYNQSGSRDAGMDGQSRGTAGWQTHGADSARGSADATSRQAATARAVPERDAQKIMSEVGCILHTIQEQEPKAEILQRRQGGGALTANSFYSEAEIEISQNRREECTRQVLASLNLPAKYPGMVEKILAAQGSYGAEKAIDACRVISLPDCQQYPGRTAAVRNALTEYLTGAKGDYGSGELACWGFAKSRLDRLEIALGKLTESIGRRAIRDAVLRDLTPAILRKMEVNGWDISQSAFISACHMTDVCGYFGALNSNRPLDLKLMECLPQLLGRAPGHDPGPPGGGTHDPARYNDGPAPPPAFPATPYGNPMPMMPVPTQTAPGSPIHLNIRVNPTMRNVQFNPSGKSGGNDETRDESSTTWPNGDPSRSVNRHMTIPAWSRGGSVDIDVDPSMHNIQIPFDSDMDDGFPEEAIPQRVEVAIPVRSPHGGLPDQVSDTDPDDDADGVPTHDTPFVSGNVRQSAGHASHTGTSEPHDAYGPDQDTGPVITGADTGQREEDIVMAELVDALEAPIRPVAAHLDPLVNLDEQPIEPTVQPGTFQARLEPDVGMPRKHLGLFLDKANPGMIRPMGAFGTGRYLNHLARRNNVNMAPDQERLARETAEKAIAERKLNVTDAPTAVEWNNDEEGRTDARWHSDQLVKPTIPQVTHRGRGALLDRDVDLNGPRRGFGQAR